MNTPNDCTDDTINRLWEGRQPEPPKHPMAEKLFREYHAGSRIMTKLEAYALGNELNANYARVVELQTENARLRQQLIGALGVESL